MTGTRTRSVVIVCQAIVAISSLAVLSGCVGLVRSNNAPLTVTMSASPRVVRSGGSATLTIKATGAVQIMLTNNVDNTTQLINPNGGTVTVNPSKNTSYTATATGNNQSAAAEALVIVSPGVINHVLFLM